VEFANQLKKCRTEHNLSQEQLAEKIFVTRQTISNWETEKSYPDVHSLMLLSSLFNVSLDQLLKGDVETMKKIVNENDRQKFKHYGAIYTVLYLVMLVSAVPLFVFLEWLGIVIWAIIAVAAFWVAKKVEDYKKEYDIYTYKEIIAFSEGKTLDEVQQHQEIGKRSYQKVLAAVISGVLTLLVCAVVGTIIFAVKRII